MEVALQHFARLHRLQQGGVDLSHVSQNPRIRVQLVGLLTGLETALVVALVAQLLTAGKERFPRLGRFCADWPRHELQKRKEQSEKNRCWTDRAHALE